jgi:hypothetical protein
MQLDPIDGWDDKPRGFHSYVSSCIPLHLHMAEVEKLKALVVKGSQYSGEQNA